MISFSLFRSILRALKDRRKTIVKLCDLTSKSAVYPNNNKQKSKLTWGRGVSYTKAKVFTLLGKDEVPVHCSLAKWQQLYGTQIYLGKRDPKNAISFKKMPNRELSLGKTLHFRLLLSDSLFYLSSKSSSGQTIN